MPGLILYMEDRKVRHDDKADSRSCSVLILRSVERSDYERIGVATLDHHSDAPVYLNGQRRIRNGQFDTLQVPNLENALCYQQSELRTIHLD